MQALTRAPSRPSRDVAHRSAARSAVRSDADTGRSWRESPAPERSRGLRDILLGLAVWGLYAWLANATANTAAVERGSAAARGRALLSGERWLHLDIERAANRWLAGHDLLGALAAWEYATMYIVTTFGVLGWLWWRRPARYARARNTLLWTTLIAIVCFTLAPTAPPRLLPDAGFVDVVARYHPILSWGGGAVSAGANQLAAMPSLHIGWAVWVTAVLLRAHAGRLGRALAVFHLVLTALVIVGTGNHYVLDIAAGAILVPLAYALERWRVHLFARATAGERVAAADEFFLNAETPTVQQPVGGFVMLRLPPGGSLSLEAMRRLIERRLPSMPRLTQRLQPAGWWRHARWVPAEPDLDWHVREHRLDSRTAHGDSDSDSDGAALTRFVAGICEEQLDRSRPLWRLWYVPDAGDGRACAIAVMHHAVGDGLGVVDTLRQLFEPVLPVPAPPPESRPTPLRRALGSAAGVAQLARDGRADQIPALHRPLSGRRGYAMTTVPLSAVRGITRATATRVSDVLLASVGHALSHLLAHDPAAGSACGRLRAAVPITLRPPEPTGTGRRPVPGNLTAALRLDVPLEVMPVMRRLKQTHAWAERRRRSARPLGAAAVVRVIGSLPPPLHKRVTRAIYRNSYFGAILSNMPGPSVQLHMAGAPIEEVYPLLPLAQGVPVAVGTLGWNGRLGISVVTDSEHLDADAVLREMVAAIDDLSGSLPRPPQPARVDLRPTASDHQSVVRPDVDAPDRCASVRMDG